MKSMMKRVVMLSSGTWRDRAAVIVTKRRNGDTDRRSGRENAAEDNQFLGSNDGDDWREERRRK